MPTMRRLTALALAVAGLGLATAAGPAAATLPCDRIRQTDVRRLCEAVDFETCFDVFCLHDVCFATLDVCLAER